MKKNILAPSLLAADFCELRNQIQITEKSGAKYLHFDVMDGVFVPSISFGAVVLQSIRKATQQILDVHLMVKEPIASIESYVKAGADNITIHLEGCEDVRQTLNEIKKHQISCGISLKPDTDIEEVLPYLSQVDMVLIMCVEPGKGGQAFIEKSYDRIHRIKEVIDKENLNVDIEVDGGIYAENIQRVIEAGANIIVAGSAVFNGHIEENTRTLMRLMDENER